MNKTLLILVSMSIILASGCEKPTIEYKNSFEQSYGTWMNFKASHGDNYRYEVSGATWAGSSWLTTITVKQGVVVQRDFRYLVFNDVRIPDDGWETASIDDLMKGLGFTAGELVDRENQEFLGTLQWTETGSELGFHEFSSASAIQTLDEVYEQARTFWLQIRPDAKTYFEAGNNGLISSCGFVPDGCMDDCFSGINIRSIEAIE